MKKKKRTADVVTNRRASFDYQLSDHLLVGLALEGLEVRAIRDNHAQLKGAFITIKDGDLWLNNLTLGTTTARNIRLLATKSQIANLEQKKQQGMTIIPTKLFPTKRYIKLEIALGKGKKRYDKRRSIKSRDLDREERRRLS